MKKILKRIIFSKNMMRALIGVAFTKPGITRLEYETFYRIFSEEEVFNRKKTENLIQMKKAS